MTDGLWAEAYRKLNEDKRRERLAKREFVCDTGFVAPTFGCACPSCRAAREAALPEAIVALFEERRREPWVIRSPLPERWLGEYVAGRFPSLEASLAALAKALNEENDTLRKQLTDLVARSPVPMIFNVKDEPR